MKVPAFHLKPWQSISFVLMASMVLLAAFIFAMGWVAYKQVKSIQTIVDETFNRSEGRYLSTRLRLESVHLSDWARAHVLQGDPQEKLRTRVFFDGSARRINELFSQMEDKILPGERSTAGKARAGMKAFVDQARALMQVNGEENGYGPRTEAAMVKLDVLRAPMLDLVRALEDMETERMYMARRESQAVVRLARWSVLGGGGLILVLTVLVAYANIRKMVVPLKQIKRGVELVAGGQLDRPIPIDRHDEFGILAETFNHMASQLRDLITNLEQRVVARTLELSEANRSLQTEIMEHQKTELELRRAYHDLKTAQDRLLQSEKMASLGQLAAGVAHEINNPVGYISTNLEVLETYISAYTQLVALIDQARAAMAARDWPQVEDRLRQVSTLEEDPDFQFMLTDVQGLLRQSREGVARIDRIVSDLKTFAREEREWVEAPARIEDIIETALGITHNKLKYHVEVRKEYAATRPVRCNALKMGQVFVNLLINAEQSITDQGFIGIRTFEQDGYMCAEISDTGCGISPENLSRIFDPFFTTKPMGVGTGLGLSISYEIVKKHGGQIRVFSEVGKGTVFTVMLPLDGRESAVTV